MKTKLRKQVTIEFLDHVKNSINDMLQTRIPQHTKQKLCIMMEKLLQETKSSDGFRYLYWTRHGKLDWDAEKQKVFHSSIPKQFITGPDDTGKLDFVSDIQGEFSRYYI